MLLTFDEVPDELSVDLAIIGAGVSGLYCAQRLLNHDPDIRVLVVERLNRTGGRLDSDLIRIGESTVREEEGGMRFNDGMVELMTLLKSLGLCDQIVPFPMSSKNDTNRYLLRGHAFTLADAAASDQMIWSQLYNLSPEEQGLSPTDLVTNAYRNVLYANGETYQVGRDPDFWTRFRTTFSWRGTLLSEWLMWGLLRDMGYSDECVQMLSDTIGFAGPFKALANAGDAFQILADFPENPDYYTLRDGFSTLPNALVTDLETRFGDRVHIVLGSNVDSIRRDGTGLTLSLTQAPEVRTARPVVPGEKSRKATAARLIVAVATKGAEDLLLRSPAMTEDPDFLCLWDAVHGSLGMRLMKINLYFERPWWEDGQTARPGVQFGPNFSDLPINAVYPFYAEPLRARMVGRDNGEACPYQPIDLDSPGIPDAPAALTIYCDFDNTNFWQGLQDVGPLFTSPLQERETTRQPQTLYAASMVVVAEARTQLQALFDVNWVPEPMLTSYRLWDGENDFEYAYHQWRQGVDDVKVRQYLSAPMDGIHFCNEAISDMHGWVNGSLRSSNAALAHFGVQPMDADPCKPDTASPKSDQPVRARALWG